MVSTGEPLPAGSEVDVRAKFSKQGTEAAVEKILAELENGGINLGSTDQGEIQVTGIEAIHANRFFCVVDYKVLFPGSNGKPAAAGIYRAVRWNVGVDSGAAALCITGDKKIVLVRNFRHAARAWRIEIPRGVRKPGETIEQCGLRESLQEAGVRPTAETVATDLGVHDADSGLLMQTPHLFAYTNVELSDKCRRDRTEAISGYFAVTVEELFGMVLRGEIVDSYTQAAALRARLQGII